jgi:hypothetical protein
MRDGHFTLDDMFFIHLQKDNLCRLLIPPHPGGKFQTNSPTGYWRPDSKGITFMNDISVTLIRV